MRNVVNPPGDPARGERSVPVTAGRHNGKLSSWALIGVVIAAFIGGGVAIIAHLWWLFWMCAGVVVLAVPAGKLVRIMDDTVSWES